MNQITNLAQFKKALIVGKEIDCTVHKMNGKDSAGNPILQDEVKPTRKVSIVQSNSFAIATEIEPGKFVDGWCTYPGAKECEFSDNKMTIFFTDKINNIPRRKILTYSFPQQ